MHRTKQLITSPSVGDCHAAAVASVLEIPLRWVPAFCAESVEWWDDFLAWSLSLGLRPLFCTLGKDADLEYWGGGVLMIGAGKSPRFDCLHCVVVRGADVVHDPHPSDDGIVGELKDVTMFVPTDPTAGMKNWRILRTLAPEHCEAACSPEAIQDECHQSPL